MTRTTFRLWTTAGACLFAVTVVSAQMSQETTGTEQQVKAAAQQMLDAAQKGDQQALAAILAENLTWVQRDGKVANKQEMLAAMQHPAAPHEVTVEQVRPYGNIALATGVAHFDNGNEFRFLQAWVNQNGEWKLMAHQGTPINSSPMPTATTGAASNVAMAKGKTVAPRLSTNDEREIWKVNEELRQAYEKGDADTYGKYTTDDYIRVEANGSSLDKSQTLKMISDFKGKSRGHLEASDAQITVSGDTARVTFSNMGTQPGGDPAGPSRLTRIYVKKNGQWQQAGLAIMPIQPQ